MEKKKFLKKLKDANGVLDVERCTEVISKSVEESKKLDESGQYNSIIVMEELGELAQQVSKALRNQLDKDALLEEMADVFISIWTLQKIYDISKEELSKAVNVKIDRINKTLEKEGIYK